MITDIRTRQEREAGPLPSELIRAGAARGGYEEGFSPGRHSNAPTSPPQDVFAREDTVSLGGARVAEEIPGREQHEAYAALGRRARRSGGEEASLVPQAGFTSAENASAAPVYEPGEAGPERAGVEQGRASQSRTNQGKTGRNGADRTGAGHTDGAAVSGGMEARSAERSFVGGTAEGSDKSDADDEQGASPFESLTDEEQREVQDLKKRDQEVRTHEQAHISAGAGLTSGGASYEKQRGPDGNMYAVGGEVQIDTSAESTPEATIAKARQVKSAALAPAQPSGQDRRVAAQAGQMEAQARQEKMEESRPPEEAGSGEAAVDDGKAVTPGASTGPDRTETPEEGGKPQSTAKAIQDAARSEEKADTVISRRAESAYRRQEQAPAMNVYGRGTLSVAV